MPVQFKPHNSEVEEARLMAQEEIDKHLRSVHELNTHQSPTVQCCSGMNLVEMIQQVWDTKA